MKIDKLRPVTMTDMEIAIDKVSNSKSELLTRFTGIQVD